MNNQKLLHDLFASYYEARRNKRNTINQLEFEFNLEENLIKLYNELLNNTYEVWESIYFIQNHPVKREIFAWNFRDRIVHHLIYNYISPIFEKQFIYDSYSCRKYKWTSFWIERLQKFIRSCSDNYRKDCYILKLDISWYFMSMNKDILYKIIWKELKSPPNVITKVFSPSMRGKVNNSEQGEFLFSLIKKVIYNNPTKNGIFKWKRSDYIWLPKNKSLFFANKWCWLPIWNLTSQLFSNIYLMHFDKYIKKELKIKYYWRYVDDFVIIDNNKEKLKKLVSKINTYLQQELWLSLHPKKIYLQHYTKGVLFLGVYIKPHRTYIRKRTIGYFYKKIEELNNRLIKNNNKIDLELQTDFISIINSYLWMLKHHKTYKKRKKLLLNKINACFWNYFYISDGYWKVKKKQKVIKKFDNFIFFNMICAFLKGCLYFKIKKLWHIVN